MNLEFLQNISVKDIGKIKCSCIDKNSILYQEKQKCEWTKNSKQESAKQQNIEKSNYDQRIVYQSKHCYI